MNKRIDLKSGILDSTHIRGSQSRIRIYIPGGRLVTEKPGSPQLPLSKVMKIKRKLNSDINIRLYALMNTQKSMLADFGLQIRRKHLKSRKVIETNHRDQVHLSKHLEQIRNHR
jgi:hypothetical protein